MKRLRLVLSCAFLLTLAPCIGSSEELRDVKYSVSIPNLKIPDGESVVSIEINVTAGAFETFENIPVGWYVVIDNDASWQVSIKANTTVGAGSLTSDELKRLRLVIIKEKDPGDLEFGISGVVGVTKDYEKETALPLKMEDFLLNNIK